MKLVISFSYLLVYLWSHGIFGYKLYGPAVYVVTPSTSRPLQIDESRSAPFYYHNWLRRMDSPRNTTIMPTTSEMPDLIFAEFESGNAMEKSLRKLLEKEKIKRASTTSTTSTTRTITTTPSYLPEELYNKPNEVNHGFSKPIIVNEKDSKQSGSDSTDYISVYNNYYNEKPAPVYLPSTTPSTTTTTTTTTTTPAPTNLENIWNIIDHQKQNENTEQWQEVPLPQSGDNGNENSNHYFKENESQSNKEIDANFALPGFSTNPGNGGENESRSIRVEPNMRFPYINLKPFQLKNMKPLYSSNKKEHNNMFTSLDHFKEIQNPVRGEAQELVPMRQPIDRYNPAQPYLPSTNYGSKQSSLSSTPTKAVANLVPPPPPPPPKITDNDFPSPVTYDSFPPYSPLGPAYIPPAAPPTALPAPPSAVQNTPAVMYLPPTDNTEIIQDSSDGSDYSPVMDASYQYKPPSPPQTFLPTLPPTSKPLKGYNYDKPSMNDIAPAMDMSKPDFHGYHYDKPDMTHAFPTDNHMKKPDFHGYHYHKPDMSHAPPPDNHPPDSYNDNDHDHPPSYGSHGPLPSYEHDTADYPELIYDKPHADMDGTKGGDDMKSNTMGMMPPPPPPQDVKPDMDAPNDHGFPHDFPGDFKYNFDEHDHDFYHHHHPTTTTTTTTEMPRVNRYSYYYLGKKLYYLPLYFSVYFIVYVGALIIKAVLRHKIVYPNSWRPNDQTASFFSKRSVEAWDLSKENLHEITGRVTRAIGTAAEKYMNRET